MPVSCSWSCSLSLAVFLILNTPFGLFFFSWNKDLLQVLPWREWGATSHDSECHSEKQRSSCKLCWHFIFSMYVPLSLCCALLSLPALYTSISKPNIIFALHCIVVQYMGRLPVKVWVCMPRECRFSSESVTENLSDLGQVPHPSCILFCKVVFFLLGAVRFGWFP